jgi:hypothetical protein
MYGLRIHGCIDGASHYVLYAKVAPNKTQDTLFEPFFAAVQKFGVHLRVRSDFAAEHALIQRFMLEVQPVTRNPFICAQSKDRTLVEVIVGESNLVSQNCNSRNG